MNNKLKACGAFIFGGSQTIGHIQSGWDVTQILEMTNDMRYNNSYHFIKNYPNIPVVDPKDWNNETYLEKLKNEKYDLLFANNPCSGLSSINRNANVNQPINDKFFEVFNIIEKIRPKSFLIENAPRLVTMGTPILQKMVNDLHEDYRFTIIRDEAGNHNVPMKRMRTLIVGWRKDIFPIHPAIRFLKQPLFTIGDAINDVTESLPNCEYDDRNRSWKNLESYYNLVDVGNSVLRMCCEHYDTLSLELNERQFNDIKSAKSKLDSGKNIWDKSPWRLDANKTCASINSLTQFIHPTKHRDLYIREYARLMGYPDDFIFYPNECKCSTVQCIAQGVPVNFIKYISQEIKNAFDKFTENYYHVFIAGMSINESVHYQHNPQGIKKAYTFEEFMSLDNLNNDLINSPKDQIRHINDN